MIRSREDLHNRRFRTFKKSTEEATDNILYSLAFENSVMANIITWAKTGKIIIANNTACKLLGYSSSEILSKTRSAIFDISESNFKKMLKQRSDDGRVIATLTGIKKSGELFPCEITSAVFADEDKIEVAITTITDLSEKILKQKEIDAERKKLNDHRIIQVKAKSDAKLAKNQEWIKYIAETSYDIMWDWDILTGKIYVGDSIEEVFGYKVPNNTAHFTNFRRCLVPGEREIVELKLWKTIASESKRWTDSYSFKRADGSLASIISRASIVRNNEGKAIRMIGALNDITKQVVLEERLSEEIRLKETQIAEAARDAIERERSGIGKELHDNVNQLLGASRLYLNMAKSGGIDSEMLLARSSEYTLTAIEEIRKLTKGLTTDAIKNFGLSEAIENVSRDMMEVSPVQILYNLESFDEYSVNETFKVNLFRIIQEQMNNISKHAGATEIAINLSQNKKSILLSISDNGVGFDTREKRKGIGVNNIISRAKSCNGKADFISAPGRGCILNVLFPFKSS